MAFEITSHASSSLQSVVAPKELLSVLNILSEKQKMKYKQEKRQEIQQHQHQQYQHLHNHYQHHGQQQHKEQQQLDKSKWESKHKESQKLMELSQIKLIYLAEGNANLVLALPQFKKVLRLPKMLKQHEEEKQLKPKKTHNQEAHRYQKNEQPQGQLKQKQKQLQQQQQQDEINQQEPSVNLTTGQQESDHDAVGILTIDHYVAYISIIRCLVGNEFVFEADIVAVPNPTDRHWINEHIKPYRPVNRLDKDFGGHFGLLLPDATQLPAEFDILFPNLQCKTQPEMLTTTTQTSNCSSNTDNSCSVSNNIFGSDAFAIEIKPKQGWLLPNDVNNLFDVKPKIKQITNTTTQPPGLRETKTTLKTAVATTITKEWDKKTLKKSTDIESFTATQNEPTATTTHAKTKVKKREKMSTTTSQTEVTMTGSCCSDSMASTSATQGDDKISHSLYDTVDPRCRYCCMQFLKMKEKKIVARSQYCPIDLFSGSNERMCFALQALFECPQNNLRIFKNGKLVYDDQISRTCKIEDLLASDKLQLIKHLLVTCLLREYDNRGERKRNGRQQINKDTQQQLLSSAASVVAVDADAGADAGADADAEMEGGVEEASAGVAAGQPQSSVTSCKKQKLNTIPIPKVTVKTTTTQTETEVTKVKSTLASTESIFSMDNSLMSTPVHYNTRCLEQINKAEMTCLPKNCVLQKILHLQSLAKINLQFMLDHEYADNKAKTYEILFKLLEKFSKADNSLTLAELSPEEQYTLAATALDCSIMITFCEVENIPKETTSLINNPFVVSVCDRTYLTKVTLLDLDPKPDAHFHKYFLQMKQIADALKEL